MDFLFPQRHRYYLDQRIDKCLNSIRQCQKLNLDQRNSPHLIFLNNFSQIMKPQNNLDQRAFHLSTPHTRVDVQLVLLMAVLEENKTSTCY